MNMGGFSRLSPWSGSWQLPRSPAPLCALCAPPSAHVPSSRQAWLARHCGSPPRAAVVAHSSRVANCDHGGARLRYRSRTRTPAAQPAASLQLSPAHHPVLVAIVLPPGQRRTTPRPALTSQSASIPLTLVPSRLALLISEYSKPSSARSRA